MFFSQYLIKGELEKHTSRGYLLLSPAPYSLCRMSSCHYFIILITGNGTMIRWTIMTKQMLYWRIISLQEGKKRCHYLFAAVSTEPPAHGRPKNCTESFLCYYTTRVICTRGSVAHVGCQRLPVSIHSYCQSPECESGRSIPDCSDARTIWPSGAPTCRASLTLTRRDQAAAVSRTRTPVSVTEKKFWKFAPCMAQTRRAVGTYMYLTQITFMTTKITTWFILNILTYARIPRPLLISLSLVPRPSGWSGNDTRSVRASCF